MPLITALSWLRQEDWEFEANMGYVERSCLSTNKTKQNKTKQRNKK
jgi:hypothetical protein